MLVIDSSQSILESDWQKFKQFTHKLVSKLPIRDDAMHLGVVEYNTNARLVTKLESDKAELDFKLASGLSKFTDGAVLVWISDATHSPATVSVCSDGTLLYCCSVYTHVFTHVYRQDIHGQGSRSCEGTPHPRKAEQAQAHHPPHRWPVGLWTTGVVFD